MQGVKRRGEGHKGQASGALTRAFDVHEVRVGMLHEALQLALAALLVGAGMKQIFRELQNGNQNMS